MKTQFNEVVFEPKTYVRITKDGEVTRITENVVVSGDPDSLDTEFVGGYQFQAMTPMGPAAGSSNRKGFARFIGHGQFQGRGNDFSVQGSMEFKIEAESLDDAFANASDMIQPAAEKAVNASIVQIGQERDRQSKQIVAPPAGFDPSGGFNGNDRF